MSERRRLTKKDEEFLDKLIASQSTPTYASKAAEIIKLYASTGTQYSEIAKAVGTHKSTAYRWCLRYQNDGVEMLDLKTDKFEAKGPDRRKLRSDERHQILTADRRQVLFWLGKTFATVAVGGLATAETLLRINAAIDGWNARSAEELAKTRARRVALEQLFFSNLRGRTAMVAGTDLSTFSMKWGNTRRSRIKPADDEGALVALANIFPNAPRTESIQPEELDLAEGCCISAGSPITNVVSRKLMYDTLENDSLHTMMIRKREYTLPWNFRRGLIAALHRTLDGVDFFEPNHEIISSSGKIFASRLNRRSGEPLNGYLLFSKLPHPSIDDAAVCIWAGNTGPATEATRLLIEDASFLGQVEIDNLIDRFHSIYFQALFEVNGISYDAQLRRHIATSISLVPNGIRKINSTTQEDA